MRSIPEENPGGAPASQSAEGQLELFFSQSLDGFFFMMLDEPVRWDDRVDKEEVLDYVFAHQRVTRINNAMLVQYRAMREEFIGRTPTDLFRHDLAYGRRIWREFFDRGRLHIETEERRMDGTPMWVEGDYICLHDEAGCITGHFGIQRDVSERRRTLDTLRQFNHRLQVLRDTDRDILSACSAAEIAETTLRRMADLVPARRSSVVLLDAEGGTATVLALQSKMGTTLTAGAQVPLASIGVIDVLRAGRPHRVPDVNAESSFERMQALRAEGMRSQLSVPLLVQGNLTGALILASDVADAFTAEHAETAHEFANHLAIAIQQARLRALVERQATELEERIRQRTAELQASENRVLAIARALPDLVFVVDEEGRYMDILTAHDHLLYRSAEALKGRRFHDIFTPSQADRYLQVVQTTLRTGETQVLEYELDVPAGARWFEGRTAVIPAPLQGRQCVVFVARDITDRKRAEELENQVLWLREELKSGQNVGELTGTSTAMQTVFKSIKMVAATDSTVLLQGETGTGKELIARAIHNLSRRHEAMMVKVNCGALPAGLIESELFGHERGAFTGATQQKKGRFELAHRGTLFLDEVGELPLDAQVKLLRVLQEQELERVGGARTIRVDVRVIAATNRDLNREVQEGRFRADLFYRLNIFPIHVPPLRERRQDIPLLATQFIQSFSQRIGRRVDRLNRKALDRLLAYDWPGNVRELANVLERAVILCDGEVLQAGHIGPLTFRNASADAFHTLEEVERQHILKALEQTGGVLAGPLGAAQLLGLNRSTLWSRMRKLGIEPTPS
jgi:formate hydrogenlyase transcriptional activator